MAFKLALIELVDRYCIAQVKLSILGNNQEEFDFSDEVFFKKLAGLENLVTFALPKRNKRT